MKTRQILGDYLIDDRGKNGTCEFAGEWIEFGSEQFPDWGECAPISAAREEGTIDASNR